jgi:hypothetical protein
MLGFLHGFGLRGSGDWAWEIGLEQFDSDGLGVLGILKLTKDVVRETSLLIDEGTLKVTG